MDNPPAAYYKVLRSAPDVMENTLPVVQTQQQRTHPVPVLVHPISRHRAVGRAVVLRLEHHPLVRDIWEVGRLGDDAVEAGALEAVEPIARLVDRSRGRREMDGRLHRGERLLQSGSTLAERQLHEIRLAKCQEIEGDERRWCLRGQPAHARVGRMDPLLERVEVESRRAGDDDLAVDDDLWREFAAQRIDELREVAGEWTLVSAAEHDFVAVAEHDAPEAVPLRFEDEFGAAGQGVEGAHALRQHRRHRRHHRQVHRVTLGSERMGRAANPSTTVERACRNIPRASVSSS